MTYMEPEQQSEAAGDLEKRLASALRGMGVPVHDAKRYLSPREFELFRQTLAPAADAYLAGGQGCPLGDLRLDPRMLRYSIWVDIINARKRREANRGWAEVDYHQFILGINHEIWQFKQQLESEKRPHFAYPPALAAYQPHCWCRLELPTTERLSKWAEPYIEKKVPPAFADFVSWKTTSEAIMLPRATYEVHGIACLAWEFTIRILATVQMELAETGITKSFYGYEFHTSVENQALGHCYVGPASWYRQVGFVTPVALLAVLAKGEVEGEGIQLTKQDRSSMSYVIAGYENQVTISTKFYQFIMDVSRDKPLVEGLRAVGVIDKLTAEIIQKKVSALSPPATAGVPADKASDDNSEVEAELENMGYTKAEIAEMIENAHLPTGMSVKDKIKKVLKCTQI